LLSSMQDQLHAANRHTALLRNKVLLVRTSSNRIRNASNPIVSLPPELLSSIFISTLEALGRAIHWSTLIRLTSVCSIWRTVAIGTPRLWTRIHCGWANPFHNINILHLQRSKNAPLRLDISMPYTSERHPVLASMAEAPALVQLGDHLDIRRVHSLRFSLPMTPNEIPLRSLQPIKHLDDLVIQQGRTFDTERCTSWLDFLERITIRRLFIDIGDSISMSPLSTASLTHLYLASRYHPSIPGFLQSASSLKDLYIRIYPSETEFAPPGDLSPIVLPVLQSLRIQGELREFSSCILFAPNLTRLGIGAQTRLPVFLGNFPKVDICEVDAEYGMDCVGSIEMEEHPLWRTLSSPTSLRRLELKNGTLYAFSQIKLHRKKLWSHFPNMEMTLHLRRIKKRYFNSLKLEDMPNVHITRECDFARKVYPENVWESFRIR